MCINPNPKANANPNLTFGFIHIFEEVQRNIQTWRQVTGMFFKAIIHVCNERLVSWYHCNFQVINRRMICNLLTFLVFIRLRCKTALAPLQSNHAFNPTLLHATQPGVSSSLSKTGHLLQICIPQYIQRYFISTKHELHTFSSGE